MTTTDSPKKHPVLVKIICVLMGLSILQGLPHLYLLITRNPRIPHPETAPLDIALSLTSVIVAIWVFMDLYRMSKRAVIALAVNVAVTVAVTTLNMSIRGKVYGIPPQSMAIGALIGLSMSLGFYFYSRRLAREGKLT